MHCLITKIEVNSARAEINLFLKTQRIKLNHGGAHHLSFLFILGSWASFLFTQYRYIKALAHSGIISIESPCLRG